MAESYTIETEHDRGAWHQWREGDVKMDYAVPVDRTISTNKALKTVCRLNEKQRAIRDFCHTHTVVISEDTNGKPYAQIKEKKDDTVSDGTI